MRAGNTHIKLLSLNVCGLVSKLRCPEFRNLINAYDIIGIQESKTDDTDDVEIPSYTVFLHNRASISRFRSGGIGLIVKDEILPYVKIDQTKTSKLVVFFTLSKQLCHLEENIKCGIIYICLLTVQNMQLMILTSKYRANYSDTVLNPNMFCYLETLIRALERCLIIWKLMKKFEK